ncbi:MAG: restriction endonuclease subunit S [Clostridia bacterium]|nr:restriction endonuclease subunit S [Clostridia bacterium]
MKNIDFLYNIDSSLCSMRNPKYRNFWIAFRKSGCGTSDLLATYLVHETLQDNPGADFENMDDDAKTELLKSTDVVLARLKDKLKNLTNDKFYPAPRDFKNPFKDAESFADVCKAAKEVQGVDWREALDTDVDHKPVASISVMNLHNEDFPTTPKSVLIAEAEMFYDTFEKLFDEFPSSAFVLTTRDILHKIAFENIFKDRNVEVVLCDIYRRDFTRDKFDLIVSAPVPGDEANKKTVKKDDGFICNDPEMVAFENLSSMLSDGGRLKIILPDSIMYASDCIGELRSYIQENFIVNEISLLPRRIMDTSGLNLTTFILLEIQKNERADREVIVRKYCGVKKNRLPSIDSTNKTDEITGVRCMPYERESVELTENKECDRLVPYEKFTEFDDWYVDRFLYPYTEMTDDEKKRHEKMYRFFKSGNDMKKFGDCADIFRGKYISKKDGDGNYRIINISNVRDYEIDYSNLDRFREEKDRKISPYVLEDGDVLITSRGTALRAAVFHKQEFRCVASSNILVIRPDSKRLDSTYLKLLLSDEALGNLICGSEENSEAMNFSDKDLMSLKVPLPPIEEQIETAKTFTERYQRYKESLCEIEKQWKDVVDNLCLY